MIKNRRDINKRERLADILPLATPFVIYIDPSSVCNFKCNFCCHSVKQKQLSKAGFKPSIMDFELFKKAIDQIKVFPHKIRLLSLFLVGEPLLNKRLPEMIAYAKKSNAADRIFLTTNGSLLSKKTTKDLIDAGLDEILISVEALNAEQYLKMTSYNIDYDSFMDNICYLNQNKKNCSVFIKIIDTGLNKENINEFHYMYDDICDFAYIEPVLPVFEGIDYSNHKVPESNEMGRPIRICARPFFSMTIHPTGNVGCCIVDYSEQIVFGNIKERSLTDIWNNKLFNYFRCMHLETKKNTLAICHNCQSPYYDTQPSDVLDDNAEDLLKYFYEEQ